MYDFSSGTGELAVIDNDDGSYSASYLVNVSAWYLLTVTLNLKPVYTNLRVCVLVR